MSLLPRDTIFGVAVLLYVALLNTPTAGQLFRPQITKFEEVHLDLDDLQTQHQRVRRTAGESPIELSIPTSFSTFHISLKRNYKMFSDQFVIHVHGSNGTRTMPFNQHNFFRGTLKGDANADVRATMLGNTIKISIEYDDGLVFVEPSHLHRRDATTSHIVFRAEDVQTNSTPTPCGVKDEDAEQDIAQLYQEVRASQIPQAQRTRARRGYQGDSTKNTCEMALVSDHRFLAASAFGNNDLTTTATTMISWLEFANRIFQFTDFGSTIGVGIQLAVAQIHIYEDGSSNANPFKTSTNDYSVFLDQVGSISWDSVCLAHGFTHQDFADGVLGLANVGTICSPPSATGSVSSNSGIRVFSTNTGMTTTVNFGTVSPELQSMLVFTHEVGHNFGMSHDTSCSVFCSDPSNSAHCEGSEVTGGSGGHYIMWPISVDGSQANNDRFSPCSIDFAQSRINSDSSRSGQCFTNSGSGPICGNGILQTGEDCDCGSTDPTECTAVDPCCQPDCTLAVGAECSDSVMPCCDSCSLIGLEVNVTYTPAEKEPFLCRSEEEEGCYTDIFCLRDPTLKGACPSIDYPYHNITDPPGCVNNASVTSCEVVYNSSLTYLYHKPRGTICNGGANICELNGCEGPLCSLFEATDVSGQVPTTIQSRSPENCILDGDSACHVACTFQDGVCVSTFEYADTAHGQNMSILNSVNRTLTPVFRAPGRVCNNFLGFCSEAGICIEGSSDDPLDIILSESSIEWLITHWYVSWSVLVGVTIIVFSIRFVNRRKGNKIVIREKAATLKRGFSFKTMLRKKENVVKKQRDGKGVLVELRRKSAVDFGENAPNESLYRLKALFPTVTDTVAHEVIRLSPHEEAAVFRLLHLGYPMRDLKHYSFLAYAGKRFKKEQRRLRREQLERARQNHPRRADPRPVQIQQTSGQGARQQQQQQRQRQQQHQLAQRQAQQAAAGGRRIAETRQ
eukprot:m.52975 g.52975  ORF g.52975 m.52975 type:complete len:961 (-) comp11345_c0_seq2:160-3042(-)